MKVKGMYIISDEIDMKKSEIYFKGRKVEFEGREVGKVTDVKVEGQALRLFMDITDSQVARKISEGHLNNVSVFKFKEKKEKVMIR